uniref:CTND2 n=1 Tax=Schistocephalus solidus TaxID=70667 RepID=A0A183TI73_SCHSO
LFRLVLAVQQDAISTNSLPLPHLCAVHAILACVMSIVVPLAPLPPLVPHVEEVINRRQETASYLLPEVAFNRKNTQETYPTQLAISEELLFSKDKVRAALVDADFDATTLDTPYPAFDPLKAPPITGRVNLPSGIRVSDYNGSVGSEYGTMRSTGQRSVGNYPPRTQMGLLPSQLNDPLGGNLAYMASSTGPRHRHSDSLSSLSITASYNSTSNQQSVSSSNFIFFCF